MENLISDFIYFIKRNVIGPENGAREKIDENPKYKYFTGMLVPGNSTNLEDEINSNDPDDEAIDDDSDNRETIGIKNYNISSAGVALLLDQGCIREPGHIRVLVSYGRYSYEDNKYVRRPFYKRLDIDINKLQAYYDVEDYGRAAVRLGVVRSGAGSIKFIIYNQMKCKIDYNEIWRYTIFQVSLRINTDGCIKFIRSDRSTDETMSAIYYDKRSYGRGYNCAAVWRDLDTEMAGDEMDEKLLKWPDYRSEYDEFYSPEIRTEFTPMYQSLTPESVKLNVDLSARGMITGSYCGVLEALIQDYEKWIEKTDERLQDKQKSMPDNVYRQLVSNINNNKTALERIKCGINTLKNSRNADRGFRFVNAVMDTVGRWRNYQNGFTWRPFQLAFLLMEINDIVNTDSDTRKLMDILWVHTGAGKTEAYMAAAIFDIIYRRYTMTGDSMGQNPGTSVISRYTLRLLTVQQFKRAMEVITAAEYIRKSGYNDMDFNDGSEYPISGGLWVGNNITPNKRLDAIKFIKNIHNNKNPRSGGNPVQIMRCPACGSLLAIPVDGGLRAGESIFVTAPDASINDQYTGSEFRISKIRGTVYEVQALKDMTFNDIANTADLDNLHISEMYKILLPGYSIVPNGRREEIQIKCRNPDCVLYDVGIPAYTVDEDIYRYHPSFIISTVDKIARLSFDPESANIFRADDSYSGPDLIIQDEMHLLTGSMGSLFGVYENAVSTINENRNVKYIAASATVNRYGEQVSLLFARRGMLFPPGGMDSSDSYFFISPDVRPAGRITPERPGRVYMGLMATGKSMQSALIDIITDIIKTKYAMAGSADIKYFWTPVLYFNSIKELSIAGSLYREDVMQRINLDDSMELDPENIEELSSRADSQEIPLILERLEGWNSGIIKNNPDALITTSMFGTGVDISRLSIMVVSGQPKMTAEYIQATGRVGRSRNALVLVLYNISRPRDRSHYEMFLQYHDKIHAYVENSPVSPWSAGSMERVAGPAFVAYARAVNPSLSGSKDAGNITSCTRTVDDFLKFTGERLGLMNSAGEVVGEYSKIIDRWISVASKNNQMAYSNASLMHGTKKNYFNSVVLGLPQDRYLSVKPDIVYPDAPQSLRDVEESGNFDGFDIRKSQFVFGYGPGSIIEGRDSSSVIKSDRIYGIIRNDISRITYHFSMDLRLNNHVKNALSRMFGSGQDIHVLELPSNQALMPGSPDDVLYGTEYFPAWMVCNNEAGHLKKIGRRVSILYLSRKGENKCPVCNIDRNSTQIRFVMACPAGHMDDIGWDYAVHGKAKNDRPEYYLWKQTSKQLKSIKIECPKCHRLTTMQDVYGIHFWCTGRYPENDNKNNGGTACRYKMHVMQRQASSLRYPETFMMLNLPRLQGLAGIDENALKTIGSLINNNNIANQLDEIVKSLSGSILTDEQWNDIKSRYDINTPGGRKKLGEAIGNILNKNSDDMDRRAIMQMEFEFLYDISENGPSGNYNGNFNVLGPFRSDHLMGFKYTGIGQIEMLIVQPYYIRNVRDSKNASGVPEPVSSSFEFGNKEYIPGIINNGDSIFIYVAPAAMAEIIKSYKNSEYRWIPALNASMIWDDYPNSMEFVLLHTLSHALIRAVSHRTGYSMASLRERVYSTDAGYGILIYSNVPGSDGSTGGLTDLVRNGMLDEIIEEAWGYIKECSNDPFCSGKMWNPSEANGAACYSCVMLPETSCEYYNKFLDRNIWGH